ncbi:MAG: prephenate dehydrogenase [Clostridiales bacterium]|nr:prephenate dehydrogenase [Clostridiales bacterium]
MYQKAGIIGLGLIGGSLAKALKNRYSITEIVAYNRNQDVLLDAYRQGVIDAYATSINEIFCGCDIVFICTPVDKIFSFAQQLTQYVSKDCVITDVGSTKGKIYERMKELENNFYYIGGHPMTGSEKFRYQASKEHLFENAYYIISPSDHVPEEKTAEFKQMTERLGAIPVIIKPHLHDFLTAAVSHIPHIVAASLVHLVQDLDTAEGYMHLLAAGGFKDTTRIAASSPEMWQGICAENREEILSVLTSLETILSSFRKDLTDQNFPQIHTYFDQARRYRDTFSSVVPGQLVHRYEINVDVLDKPGSIAVIAVLLSSRNINIKNIGIVNNRETDNGVISIAFDTQKQQEESIALLRSMNYEVSVKQ